MTLCIGDKLDCRILLAEDGCEAIHPCKLSLFLHREVRLCTRQT